MVPLTEGLVPQYPVEVLAHLRHAAEVAGAEPSQDAHDHIIGEALEGARLHHHHEAIVITARRGLALWRRLLDGLQRGGQSPNAREVRVFV